MIVILRELDDAVMLMLDLVREENALTVDCEISESMKQIIAPILMEFPSIEG
jgi:hypothetical protein